MIVPVNIEHLEDILSIEKQSFDKPWSDIHFEQFLTCRGPLKSVVYLDNLKKPVGYLFGQIYGSFFYLQNIAVRPGFRRQKIATKLLDYIVNQSRKNRLNKIVLEVRANNSAARRLYEKDGFKPIGVEKNYYTKGTDAIVYELEIE